MPSRVRKTYSTFEKQIATTQITTFKQVMLAVLALDDPEYYQLAITKLKNILDANSDNYILKKWHVDCLSQIPEIEKDLKELAFEEATESARLVGIHQCVALSRRQNDDSKYLLITKLKFSPTEADIAMQEINTKEIADSVAAYGPRLLNFVNTRIPDFFAQIISRMQARKVSAEVAFLSALEQVTEGYYYAKNLLSAAMREKIDDIGNQANATQIIFTELEKGDAIQKKINDNRYARCQAVLTCSQNKKLNTFDIIQVLIRLDPKGYKQHSEEVLAIQASIGIDDNCCSAGGVRPSFFKYYNPSLKHHLGFFMAKQLGQIHDTDSTAELSTLSSAAEEKPKFTFRTVMNSLYRELSKCSSDQFLSVVALGLLTPTINTTIASLTGTEMVDIPRLGMNV
ncbi:MAG: hypothetical protein V4501_10540 [Pseudomonadota bacterium]